MNFLKHHIYIITTSAVISLGIIIYAIWGISGYSKQNTVPALRMALQEEVKGSGTVEAAESVDLAFERGGTIAEIYADAGDKVTAGQWIVALDSSEQSAQLAQAEADVKTQQAKLDELKRGARPEDIANQNIAIQNSQVSLQDADQGMFDKVQDAYTKADDAIRSKADQMFNNPQSNNPDLAFFTTDSQAKTDLDSGRLQIEISLKKWSSSLDTLSAGDDLSSILDDSKQNLLQIKSFLDKLSLAINNPNSCVIDFRSICQPIPSTWKIDIGTARGNINLAISNLTGADSSRNVANSNLALAEQGLNIKESGASAEQISAAEAQLERSIATKNLVQSQLYKTVIRSPIDGVVSKQAGKVGAIASPNQPLVSVMSDSKYQMEIFVPEIDISKIKIGQPAKVTLDAYGEGDEFDASVIKADPASTIVGGVNAYKVTLQFTNNDSKIKSGMGANIVVETASATSTIAIPANAVITKKNDKVVLVSRNGSAVEERKVTLGIKGSNGYVEILSGLKEGEKVETF